MSDYEVIIYHGAGTITYSRSTTTRVVSLYPILAENKPWMIKMSLENNGDRGTTDNFLNSSFAEWTSGTGAIALGDLVKVSLYPTSSGTKTQVMYCIITSLHQNGSVLEVEAYTYLKRLEVNRKNKMIFSGFRDRYALNQSTVDSLVTIEGLDSDIHNPPVRVEFFNSDFFMYFDDSVEHAEYEESQPMPTYDLALQFIPNAGDYLAQWVDRPEQVDGDYFGAYRVYWYLHVDAGVHSATVRVGIQEDVDGEPSGTYIGYGDDSSGTEGLKGTVISGDANQPVILQKGKKYWIVWHCVTIDADAGNHLHINVYDADYSLEGSNGYWYSFGGWTQATGKIPHCGLNLSVLHDIPFSDIEYDASGNRFVLLKNPGVTTEYSTSYWTTFYRGVVSYFYGTVTAKTILETIIGLDGSVTATVDASCSTTWAMYRLRGKTLLDGLQEVCDVVDDSGGSFNGRQYVFQAYWDGATNSIIVRSRYLVSDSALATFKHALDDSTDSYRRIISTDLKKVSEDRPSAVMVIGQDSEGNAIAVFRTDEATASSFRTSSKIPTTFVVTDKELRTLDLCSDRAFAILDKYARGSWEGSITVDGIYPDLFNLVNSSNYYGSGGVVALTCSPIGMSSETKFKVTSVEIDVFKETTKIFLNNYDILIENKIKTTQQITERFDAVTNDEMEETLYFPCYDDTHPSSVISGWIQLLNNDGDLLGDRMPASYISNDTYNAEYWTATFPQGQSTTAPGHKVAKIRLYATETGGTYYAEYVLSSAEQFEKFKTQVLVVELMTKHS